MICEDDEVGRGINEGEGLRHASCATPQERRRAQEEEGNEPVIDGVREDPEIRKSKKLNLLL